jgi:hypothetical protein
MDCGGYIHISLIILSSHKNMYHTRLLLLNLGGLQDEELNSSI